MKRSVVRAMIPLVLAIVAIVCLVVFIPSQQEKKVDAPVQTEVSTQSSPQVAEATSDNYKLIVGANPMISQNQTFSPPTNSVVITNEAQLRLLIEQTRPRGNTNSSQ